MPRQIVRPLKRSYDAEIEAYSLEEALAIAEDNATRGLGYHAEVRPADVHAAPVRGTTNRWHVAVLVTVR